MWESHHYSTYQDSHTHVIYTLPLANIVTTAAPLLKDSLATAFPIPLLPPVICINRHIHPLLYTTHPQCMQPLILECVFLLGCTVFSETTGIERTRIAAEIELQMQTIPTTRRERTPENLPGLRPYLFRYIRTLFTVSTLVVSWHAHDMLKFPRSTN